MNGPARADKSASILIVDDTPTNLSVLAECLETSGYRVLVAQGGEEGAQRAELVRPDLVLLDVAMPDLDGYATCRRIKANAATADIPVIFMTASTDSDSKVAGFAAGGVDFITKPFETAEVLARVGTHIAIAEMRAALAKQNQRLQHEVAERQTLNRDLEQRVAERTRELEKALQDSRRLLSDKETLLAEVHHRVRNNLQAICTLIQLKAYQFSDPAIQQAFTDTLARISAMRLVHEALYSQDDCTDVDFGSYLGRLADALVETYGVRGRIAVNIDADGTRLDLATAIPVGLIAAEAVANAMKHAFPNGRLGRVTLDFRTVDGSRVLRISDDGVGFPSDRPRSPTAGVGLMNSLASQVGGTLDWSRGGIGTRVTLVF